MEEKTPIQPHLEQRIGITIVKWAQNDQAREAKAHYLRKRLIATRVDPNILDQHEGKTNQHNAQQNIGCSISCWDSDENKDQEDRLQYRKQ